MKALEIAELFRAAFAADGSIVGLCVNEQSTADYTRPAAVFAVTTKALNGSGSALTYTLALSVESPADKRADTDPDPATAHAARVEAARAKLLGAGKAALLTALNAAGTFDFRGWDAADSDPAVTDKHFATPLNIAGVCLVL